MNASFESATSIIRGLGEDKVKLRTERDLLRAKITRMTKQHKETTALLQRTGVIVKKLMDKNAMLRIEHERLVEESVDAASSVLRT
jgi:hypothetical protein